MSTLQESELLREKSHKAKLIIIEFSKQVIALAVDEIKGIRKLNKEEIYLSRALNANNNYFFNGAIIDHLDNINLVLNVEYMVKQYLKEINLPQPDSQIIFFDLSTQFKLTQNKISYKQTIEENNLLLFKIQDLYYTFPSISVIQLLKSLYITPAANTAPYILGSTSFRGEILPIIDLNSFFNKTEIKDEEPTKDYNYIAINHKGNRVIFSVETVIGNIGSPDVSTITNFPNIQTSIEPIYFETGFIHDGKIILQLRQEAILNKINEELKYFQNKFIEENEVILSPVTLPDSLEVLNINLQDKLTKYTPTYSSLKAYKQVSRALKVSKHTGTLISTGTLDIIIPNDQIIEIYSIQSITEVPNTSLAVLGAINFRGEVISVLNLSEILGTTKTLESENINQNDRILIFEVQQQLFALHVVEIKGIVEINEADIHPVIASKNSTAYYFKAAIIDSSGKIILILNIDYLFNNSLNADFLDQKEEQLILFSNPSNNIEVEYQDLEKKGIIFTSNNYYFFLPSKNVLQIIENNSYLLKDYSVKALIGAAIHYEVVPLIDFNVIINSDSNMSPSTNSNGILIYDSDIGSQITILIDKIVDSISTIDFEAYKDNSGISEELLPPLISGFFSYSGKLGMEINPKILIDECTTLIKQNLKLENIKEEFKTTLSLEELEYLESVQESRKELELMLFYRQKGQRFEFFVFKWRDLILAIDVKFVKRVFSSKEIRFSSSDPELSPLIGISELDNVEIPLFDLSKMILSGEDQTEINVNSFFFLLKHQKYSFLVPVDNIEGIITKFEQELSYNEDDSLFLQGKEVSKSIFEHEKISSNVYIIENEYLNKIFEQNRVTSNLETLLRKYGQNREKHDNK